VKVYALAPNENWICDRFVKEWNEHAPCVITEDITECDILWLLADWCWDKISPNLLLQKKVVASVHHITPEKFGEKEVQEFLQRDQFVDAYHVPCLKTKEQIQNLTEKEIFVQPFWVNSSLWHEITSDEKASARSQIGINDSHFLVGSFQRDTEGHDLVSPKLEKGPDLFCDAVYELSEKYKKENKQVVVLLAGWRRQYVMNRLEKMGIKFYYAELPPFETINVFYNMLDLYIVSARHEGGPQAIVECAATRTPIVSTDVGVASVVLAPESIFTPGEITEARPNIDYAYNQVQKYFIPSGFDSFVDFFGEI